MRDKLAELIRKANTVMWGQTVLDKQAESRFIADYLIKNGVILPQCKVGDTVYIIGSKYRKGRKEKWINTGKFRLSDIDKIGKTVFLTEKEALKELENRKECKT